MFEVDKMCQSEEAKVQEMDLSDADSTSSGDENRDRNSPPAKKQRKCHVDKEETDVLRCQLDAYKNEVALIKSDMKAEIDAREQQISQLKAKLEYKNDTEENNTSGDALKIIGIVSVFLHAHPFGCDLESIHNYVQHTMPGVSRDQVESVLKETAFLFSTTTNNGNSQWKFTGFN